MRPRTRNAALGAALLLLAAAWAFEAGWLRPPPDLRTTPEAMTLGRRVLADRCLHCHATIPLAPRVQGWSAERAYDALGRLPELRRAMPPFVGTEEERRALAVYLSEAGAGRAPLPPALPYP